MAVYADGTVVRVGDIVTSVDEPVHKFTRTLFTGEIGNTGVIAFVEEANEYGLNVICRIRGSIAPWLSSLDLIPVRHEDVDFDETEFLSLLRKG